MSIRQDLQTAQKEAMKSGEKAKLSTIRLLLSAIKNQEIVDQKELDDAGIQTVVAKQVKQLQDAIKEYAAGGRDDLADQAKQEVEILAAYLPEQMSDEKLAEVVKNTVEKLGASSPADMGKVMGTVMQEVKGLADGNRVKEMVSKELNKN